MRLTEFIENVHERIRSIISDDRLHPDQREVLAKIMAGYRAKVSSNPASDPLAIYHFIHSARGRGPDETSFLSAAFCVLFLLCADLLDDIQDGEIDGGPHAAAGTPIAINNAVLMLVLAIEALRAAGAEGDGKGDALLEAFTDVGIEALHGQHLDLGTENASRSVEEVLEINRSKTSSLALIARTAAICAGCDGDAVALYGRAGRHMSGLVQLVDDVRDIFGKDRSPDLEGNKTTYPVAVFLDGADDAGIRRFEDLRARLPAGLEEIEQLFYEAGVVDRCAEAIEKERKGLHNLLASTGLHGPGHRMWLHIADALAASVYEIPMLECSKEILLPEGDWHERVREAAAEVHRNLAGASLPPPPALVPWHGREWVFVPEQKRIYYSDLQDQADEILPVQAATLGCSHEEAMGILRRTIPAVTAHELFHYWRWATGSITENMWLEEWAANRLAAAYLTRIDPDLARETLEVTRRISKTSDVELCAEAAAILAELVEQNERTPPEPRGYGMDTTQMILLQASMLEEIHSARLDLDTELSRWLPESAA